MKRETLSKKLGKNPLPTSKDISKVMKSNKRNDSIPELILRKNLRRVGLKGYRKNYSKIPGSPDVVFISRKIAIFVNGCFWHRCPKCNLPLPKNNTEFWKVKFERNIERDRLKIQRLEDMGWTVIVIWECDIKKNIDEVLERINFFFNLFD